MPERPIQIMSVNMNRQSLLTHALLQTSTADIILIQEPWIGTVQTARSDLDPLGTPIPGATNNNMWECFLPSFTDPKTVRVAAYVKVDLARTFAIVNHISHPLSSLESMTLDFTFEEETLRILNIYHRIPLDHYVPPPSPPLSPPGSPAAVDGPVEIDGKVRHNLLHLFSNSLDPLIPTLVVGDFNTHSHIWSLPHSTISPWASDLVDWFDDQGLELLSPPRVATWKSGKDGTRPSVLDLALINEAAAISGQISDLHISFNDSISSDHAALSLLWSPAESIAIAPPPELSGYAVDPLYSETWAKIFSPLPSPPIMDIPSLDAAATTLQHDIDHASSRVFRKRQMPDPRES